MNELVNNISLYLPDLVLLRFISFLISVLLVSGIIYLLIKLHFVSEKTDFLVSVLRGSSRLSQRRVLRGWKSILKFMRSKKAEDWQSALMEADGMLDEVLKLAGYYGRDLTERLENITVAQLGMIDDLRQAHQLALKVQQDPGYPLNKEAADEAAYIYGKTFRELRLID